MQVCVVSHISMCFSRLGVRRAIVLLCGKLKIFFLSLPFLVTEKLLPDDQRLYTWLELNCQFQVATAIDLCDLSVFAATQL